MKREVVIVHLSDLQFGSKNRFDKVSHEDKVRYEDEQAFDHFLDTTLADIGESGLRPDVVLCSGDLAEEGRPAEIARGFGFLGGLVDKREGKGTLDLPRERVVVVPGNHDINWTVCQHAREEAALEARPFRPPYIEKFRYFRREFNAFYKDRRFPDDLFQVVPFKDLGLLVLALNSCYAESELEEDHYGDLGPDQVSAAFREASRVDPHARLLRMVVLHHGLEPDILQPTEALRDPQPLLAACQDAGARVVLHGHSHMPGAYVKGSPDRPPVYVLASGSAGLDGPSLPDVLNHYSVLVLRPTGFMRRHRQYSTQTITSTGRGRWREDPSHFERGVEVAPFFPPLDVYPGWPEEGAKSEVEDLRARCERLTSEEIERSAKKKYIPSLYIAREAENEVGQFLIGDDELATTLVRVRETLYRSVTECMAELKVKERERSPSSRQPGVQSDIRELKARARTLERLHPRLEREIDSLLSEGRPCDGKHKPTLLSVAANLATMDRVVAPEHSSTVAEALAVAERSGRAVAMLIDRAGGGKTNMLCHMATDRSKCEPTLYVGGRLPIEDQADLLEYLAQRLGHRGAQPPGEYLAELDERLSLARSHLTVFLDGINETRDIGRLNEALEYALEHLAQTRIRFVIACRDIYWTFFKDAPWTQHVSTYFRNKLYQFTLHEYPAAVRKYLEHFKLQVDLGSDAWARCRHPLLLRFFCEAYARPTSGPQGFEPVRLGRIEEIRLKPLFDDYWSAKTKQLAGARAYADAVTAEQCLLSLARHMLDSNSAVVTTIEFPRITGVRDLTSNASLYLSLVDEDVIIEEHPTRRLKVRRVVFVYEEFMEYVAARELYSILKHEAPTGLLDLFNMLKKKAGEFVNSLGIAEYVVACLLDDGLHKSAFALLSMMAQEGGPWDAIVANVFTKYDQAIEMVLTFVKTSRDLQSIQRLLSSVGRDSRPAMTDICVELGFRVAFPAVLTFEHVRHGALPAELPESAPCLWDTNPTVGRGIVRLIATSIDAFSVNPARSVLWRSWKGNRKYVDPGDRHELVRALWNLVGGSPRRSGILAYACNGLFDEHEEIRKAAAFFGRDSDRPIVREIREWRLERETDPEVRELLLLQTAAAMPFMN